MKRNTIAIIGFLFTAGLVSGCATPQGNIPALMQARQEYSAAQNDPVVAQYGKVPLYEAGQALQEAENAKDETAIRHWSLIAQQRVELARAEARNEVAKQDIAQLSQEQQKVLLQARQQQAQQAQQQAQQAQQQAQQARQKLQSLQQQQTEDQLQQQRRLTQQAQARNQELERQLDQLRTEARQTPRGILLTMSDVYFPPGKATLKPGADQNLAELARIMKQHPDRRLVIEGYTDNTGPADINLRLSRERADAVAKFLIAQGINLDRIVAMGYGENFPVASNDTAAGRQLNRRVEIVIPNAGQDYQPPAGPPATSRQGAAG